MVFEKLIDTVEGERALEKMKLLEVKVQNWMTPAINMNVLSP